MPVLIVEDDKYMNETLCELLESEGFDVDSAVSVNEALKKLDSHAKKYYLLILDYNLQNFSGLTGIDIYALAKQRYVGIKGIMISAYGDRKIKEMAREKGINLFLDKPFLITDLLKILYSINLSFKSGGDVNSNSNSTFL